MGAVVVDAEAAANVDVIHRQAERAQLAVVADGFLEAVLVVGQVGDLRAHVEMQQAHALVETGLAEALDHRQQLGGGKAGTWPSRHRCAHFDEASEDSRTRRPTWGCTPTLAASSITSCTSDSFSITMNTLCPSFCPISASLMNSRSL